VGTEGFNKILGIKARMNWMRTSGFYPLPPYLFSIILL
jgi:hypothetical protein